MPNTKTDIFHYQPDIADTILPLFGCLKDSCEISDRLLTDYKEAQGYELLTDAILNVSLMTPVVHHHAAVVVRVPV